MDPVLAFVLDRLPQWATLIAIAILVLKNIPIKSLLKPWSISPTERDPLPDYVMRTECERCMTSVGESLDVLRSDVRFVRDTLVGLLAGKAHKE